jgi:hypothetical protein
MSAAQEMSWESLQPPDPSWWHGATGREVCQFDLYPAAPGYSRGDGVGLDLRLTEDLKDDAALAHLLLSDPRTKTNWLTSYARLLAHELRRRAKTVAACA